MARPTDKRWKGILIDWPTIEDMDSEDYELKPLNQQQVAILLALLEYQKWPTRWTGLEMSKDELETYIADIEERLMRNEGGMATKDDIRDGMYEAMNRLAAQIVSGRYTDIAVDEDGNVTQPSTGAGAGAELPEDDPTTPAVDESLAAAYGGTYATMKALEQLYDKLDSYYGGTIGLPLIPEAQAQFNIKNLFSCDEAAMDAAITSYYSYRGTTASLAFTPTTANIQYFFCHGSNERGWTQFLADVSGFAFAKQSLMASLSAALAADFWTYYYNNGTSTPSTDYLDASCVRSPTEIGYIVTLGVAFISQTQWKNNHRIRITAEGFFTDVDSDTLDAWWYIDPPAVPVNRLSSNNTQVGSNTTKPSLNVVPYNAAHKYVWTMDNNSGGAADYRLTISASGMNTPTSSTGGIKVTVEDLGEINQL